LAGITTDKIINVVQCVTNRWLINQKSFMIKNRVLL
jgi:hypothetical protein